MDFQWQHAFSGVKEIKWKDTYNLSHPVSFTTLHNLKRFLDFIHTKFCLIRPFFQREHYPVVIPQELLPSFESNLYEYTDLPGFSLVVLDRPLDYFQEIFQFDILHCIEDVIQDTSGPASPFEPVIIKQNQLTFESRLPKLLQEEFRKNFESIDRITNLVTYPNILNYLLHMDKGHVLAKNKEGDFYFSGIYASFPSDLDFELKKFGLKTGKFVPGDNRKYDLNRNFVYQFLMELYGFPIAGERRTSVAFFARKLFNRRENFLIKVLAQSDRTITTLYTTPENKSYPKVEKIALVSVHRSPREQVRQLEKGGFLLSKDPPVAIVRAHYRQHKYDPNNIRTDRALSLVRQEIIHPISGEVSTSVNILKDATLMTVLLNDIVKGEYWGRIKYKKNEIIENTDTHNKRLKFLYSWLRKNQRRIISYSDEFFANISKVLNNYLLNPKYYKEFQKYSKPYLEVWRQYKYIQQARKIKHLEDIHKKKYQGQKINYVEMFQYANQIIQELKSQPLEYFDTLIEHALYNGEAILNIHYIIKQYIEPPKHELTNYGCDIREAYSRLKKSLEDLKSIQESQDASDSKTVSK